MYLKTSLEYKGICLKKLTQSQLSMNIQSQNGLKGTPIYMAPEIFTDEKYSKSSDVYAFSFIVYELLTLEVPFKNFSIQKIFKMIVSQGYRPEIKEDIPICYKELIEKNCFSFDDKISVIPKESFKKNSIIRNLFVSNGVKKNWRKCILSMSKS